MKFDVSQKKGFCAFDLLFVFEIDDIIYEKRKKERIMFSFLGLCFFVMCRVGAAVVSPDGALCVEDGAVMAKNMNRTFVYQGKFHHQAAAAEKSLIEQNLQSLDKSAVPVALRGAWLYGKDKEVFEKRMQGVVVVAPPESWLSGADDLSDELCGALESEAKTEPGCFSCDMALIFPMRGALPLMELVVSKLFHHDLQEAHSSPALQGLRKQSEQGTCTEKHATAIADVGGGNYRIVCLVDDVIKSGGTALDTIYNILKEFPACQKIYGRFIFGVKSVGTPFAFGDTGVTFTPGGDACPAQKMKGLEDALQRVFLRKVQIDMKCRYLLSSDDNEPIWVASPFEGAMPTFSSRSKLFDMLFGLRGQYCEHDLCVRCIFVPAVIDGFSFFYDTGFDVSNEWGDLARYARHFEAMHKEYPCLGFSHYEEMLKMIPKDLMCVPGTIRCPAFSVKEDLKFPSDPFCADRAAVHKVTGGAPLSASETLVVLSDNIPQELRRDILKSLKMSGYQVVDFPKMQKFCPRVAVFPIVEMSELVPGVVRSSASFEKTSVGALVSL